MDTRMRLLVALIFLLVAVPLVAQQTGSISGKVLATDGSALPGVTVEARSNVLPQPRTTTTDSVGNYRLPALQPGTYTVAFSLAGMQSATRRAEVQLAQDTALDVKMGIAGVSENITITASATLVDKTSTDLASGLSTQEIGVLPVGTDYRDIIKLAPGVQQTPDSTRGPSAGGSGQDNVYQIDGVNVTFPMYGTLTAEPSSYDVAQVTVSKGGAKAIDFGRAGGFQIDSVSKSGTNKFAGQVAYRLQNHASWMTASQKVGQPAQYNQDKSWADLAFGGPVLLDRLFFYGSYYRPEVKRSGSSNVYGQLPDYGDTRNEYFGKLTFTPTASWLVNGSYRASKHDLSHSGYGNYSAPTQGQGYETKLNIGTIEGSWLATQRSYATFKLNDYKNRNSLVPDFRATATPSTALGTKIDIANLDKIGSLSIPSPIAGNDAFNTFLQPYIDKYGYMVNGVRTGGGAVGVYSWSKDADDFFRKSGQAGYNMTLGSNVTHDVHIGYQRYTETEELQRLSNGWGSITLQGGRIKCPTAVTSCAGQPIYYQAQFFQASLGSTPVRKIHAEYQSQNIEINDTINLNRWSFNLGLLASNDILYGQGLKNDSSTISGFVLSPGSKYKMYEMPWKKMIQPRVGVTWAYNGQDTVYTSMARYNPATSSLPRAAAWDRNYTIREIRAYFDQSGSLIGVDPLASSSGKLFVDDLNPRQVWEYLVGTSQQISSRWSGRVYGRYRKATNFWEDTNNTARVDYKAPAPIPNTPYMPDLNAKRAQIGSGSSYVITTLDGAFTKYYEVTSESEYRGDKYFVRGSYTWSHYYGNFDQDNTTTDNDGNYYIGSSNIGDGPGRQLWNFKYGDLHGDRRHVLKLTGAYFLPWHASAGAYALYQSGKPWETWDYRVYSNLPGINTNSTIRFAEPAGSRSSPSHTEIDVNYTQNFGVRGMNLQLAADVFNILDSQTGYNINPVATSSTYGQPQNWWRPRTVQITARVQF